MIEVGFILFLFYSNLLMGEFERSGGGTKSGLFWDLSDIFTRSNFEIAAVAAVIGHVLCRVSANEILKQFETMDEGKKTLSTIPLSALIVGWVVAVIVLTIVIKLFLR